MRIGCDEAHMSLLLHKLPEALVVLKERMMYSYPYMLNLSA